jgi:hypothetical protein
LLHAIHRHLLQRFYSPYGFLGLEISTTAAESGWGLSIDISIVISLTTLYLYINIFPIQTTIRNALKGGKPDKKPQ